MLLFYILRKVFPCVILRFSLILYYQWQKSCYSIHVISVTITLDIFWYMQESCVSFPAPWDLKPINQTQNPEISVADQITNGSESMVNNSEIESLQFMNNECQQNSRMFTTYKRVLTCMAATLQRLHIPSVQSLLNLHGNEPMIRMHTSTGS